MTQPTRRELQSDAGHPAEMQGDFDGELVTAPWLGLHYRSETA
ncbi:hypothetical protein [Arthrobacter sp. OAP107]|jgi:hypothetical protein